MRVRWESKFLDGKGVPITYTGEVVGYASPGHEVVAVVRSEGGLHSVQLYRLKVIDG